MIAERLPDMTGKVRVLILYGVLQFFLLTFLAAFFYPGGYDYLNYYFSDLGAVTARNSDVNTTSAILFFIALATVSITLVPFWLGLFKFFSQSRVERISSLLGSVMGLICSPVLIGVALFTIDTQLEIHFVLVLVQFSLFSFAILLYSIAILLGRRYSNLYGLVGLIVLAIGVVLMVDPIGPYAALLQKIAVYSYFLWVMVMMYQFRLKTR
ncbi:MAG: DUF998 domain-containing protein [Candidatus Thorarchaeota archaeon]